MEPLFEIELERVAKGARDSSATLYRQLEAAIADGRLRPGTRLPPVRKAARLLGVSRNTAVKVYEKLVTEGYVVARRGSGTYVAAFSRAAPSRTPTGLTAKLEARLNEVWLRPDLTAAMGFWRDRPVAADLRARSNSVDFRPALIDPRLFPSELFRRLVAQQLRGLEKRPPGLKSPQGNHGNYHLRNAIAKHVALTRAVACLPDDIVVTSGAQQAFDLLARILVKPNQTVVAVEDPGYPPMRAAFAAAGAKLVPVSVDAEGLIIEQLPPDVGVISVCPSHQFPLGITMSAGRRKALVEFAHKRGAILIEDDYDGEFRYDGSPLRALRASDSADVVFYLGTFSKCMLPALRLGFIVAPRWAMQALVLAKNCLDWHCPTLIQIAVAKFIAEGHLARHVRKMRQIYQKRRLALSAALQRDFKELLEPLPSYYGMHVAAVARPGLNLERVADALLDSQVKIHTFSRYYMTQPLKEGLVFGYGVPDLAQIERGLGLLRKALPK